MKKFNFKNYEAHKQAYKDHQEKHDRESGCAAASLFGVLLALIAIVGIAGVMAVVILNNN